jgi:hypothetical protein
MAAKTLFAVGCNAKQFCSVACQTSTRRLNRSKVQKTLFARQQSGWFRLKDAHPVSGADMRQLHGWPNSH